MSNAIFKKSSLSNYGVISGPGTFIVKVSNSVKPEYLIEDGSKSRYIVNLKVATVENFKKCLNIMGNKELIEFDDIKQCFMSGTLWYNDLKNTTILPVKGENVIASFDYVEEQLRCISLTLIPRKQLASFDLASFCSSRKLLKDLLTMKNEGA
jgi:hypothetical protein